MSEEREPLWSPFFGGRGEHRGARQARAHARRARAAENAFARQLRAIARHVGDIVRGIYRPDQAEETIRTEQALWDYGQLIEPWARAVAERMLADVMRRDAAGWHQLGQLIHRALLGEIATTPMQAMLDELRNQQISLITSLPRDASIRVHEWTLAGWAGRERWETIAQRILETGEVTLGRANLIARTESSRTASEIQGARAQHVGSEGFIWRTAKDRDVRPLHREYEGRYFRWDAPPPLDDGRPGLPGTIWSCRCWAEIVIAGEVPGDQPLQRNPAYLAALREAGYTEGAAFE